MEHVDSSSFSRSHHRQHRSRSENPSKARMEMIGGEFIAVGDDDGGAGVGVEQQQTQQRRRRRQHSSEQRSRSSGVAIDHNPSRPHHGDSHSTSRRHGSSPHRSHRHRSGGHDHSRSKGSSHHRSKSFKEQRSSSFKRDDSMPRSHSMRRPRQDESFKRRAPRALETCHTDLSASPRCTPTGKHTITHAFTHALAQQASSEQVDYEADLTVSFKTKSAVPSSSDEASAEEAGGTAGGGGTVGHARRRASFEGVVRSLSHGSGAAADAGEPAEAAQCAGDGGGGGIAARLGSFKKWGVARSASLVIMPMRRGRLASKGDIGGALASAVGPEAGELRGASPEEAPEAEEAGEGAVRAAALSREHLQALIR